MTDAEKIAVLREALEETLVSHDHGHSPCACVDARRALALTEEPATAKFGDMFNCKHEMKDHPSLEAWTKCIKCGFEDDGIDYGAIPNTETRTCPICGEALRVEPGTIYAAHIACVEKWRTTTETREGLKTYQAVCRNRWCQKYFYEGPDKPPALCPECASELDVMSTRTPSPKEEDPR